MCISRRAATFLVVLGTVAAFTPSWSPAFPTFSDWPARGVKIIVPFPPGSADDIAARLYADGLAKRWAGRRLSKTGRRPMQSSAMAPLPARRTTTRCCTAQLR